MFRTTDRKRLAVAVAAWLLFAAAVATGQVIPLPPSGGGGSAVVDTLTVTTGPSLFPDGVVGAPAVSFTSDPDTGLWRGGSNDLRLSVGGAASGLRILSGSTLIHQQAVITSSGTVSAQAHDPRLTQTAPRVLRLDAGDGGAVQFVAPDGTAAAPSYSFTAATGDGISRNAGFLTLSAAGVARLIIGSTVVMNGGTQFVSGVTAFATLPTSNVATQIYCSDCTPASNPCTGGGSGTMAFRINGGAPAWKCL